MQTMALLAERFEQSGALHLQRTKNITRTNGNEEKEVRHPALRGAAQTTTSSHPFRASEPRAYRHWGINE